MPAQGQDFGKSIKKRLISSPKTTVDKIKLI